MPEELKPCPICGENMNLMVMKNNHPIAADKPYYIQCGAVSKHDHVAGHSEESSTAHHTPLVLRCPQKRPSEKSSFEKPYHWHQGRRKYQASQAASYSYFLWTDFV